ncbi:MAG TPA: hypothetical protein VFK14_13280 [Solirubrobacterales bacterium]|nr:hypothetical protein [Solirubrobacterales bacterium]
MKGLLPAFLATLVLALGGCTPGHDEGSLVARTFAALREVGASEALTRCLTRDLGDYLTERDAEVAYEDLASEPDVSERSLNRISLLEKDVKRRLLQRGRGCMSALVSDGRYTRGEVEGQLRRVGARGYQRPGLFRLAG